VKLFSSKRRWFAAALVLLLLFLFRPGASRLKTRIISSVSSGLGRSVDIGTVHLRLLPRPGFDLENLVVYDDAAFGAEPILRAGEVTASLRLLSVVRGKIEIARLNLTEPSLNLVRGDNGHWNLETLLERTARTPLAPTAKAKSEPRPGFPYIEATSARINFKYGPEKKAYALTNADFSLWQESENTWGVRLKAQPVRTDLNLNDTGIIRVNGTWQRAASLRDTPLQFSMEWERAQIGQLTKLASGLDQGWRGGMQVDLTLQGTPAKLQIGSDTAIDDFRRYDITSGEPLHLAAHCDAQYSSTDRTFREILCNAPVHGGYLALKGEAGLPGTGKYALMLSAHDVPADSVAALIRRTKKNLPDDLVAAGMLRGSVSLSRNGTDARFDGRGEISAFQLTSATSEAEIGPETVPFLLTSADLPRNRMLRQAGDQPSPVRLSVGPHIELGPLSSSRGRVTLRGWLARAGYSFYLSGEGEAAKILASARLFGVPALRAAVEGPAQLDLQVAGAWTGWRGGAPQTFSGPQVSGIAKLHNTRVILRGTGAPIDIVTGDLRLFPDRARLENLTAKVANTSWTGWVELPRGCGTPSACEAHVVLNTKQISFADVANWVSPRGKDKPWYRVLQTDSSQPSFLATVRASAHIVAERAQMEKFSATHVAANLTLENGKLQISEMEADVLGGKYRGAWNADFTAKPPTTTGSGTLKGVILDDVAAAMGDRWISGTGNGSFKILATGSSTPAFWQSAEGTLRFELRNGELSHISLENEGPLRIVHLAGELKLQGGTLETKGARLDSPEGNFDLTGTASFKRQLELKLSRHGASSGGYAITGTLAAPKVQALPGSEEARLKR
jgi:uncharacterized protein involved in outer membrane biogenesis